MSEVVRRLAKVDARSAGARLDLWMVSSFPEMSRKKAKKLIDAGAVSINGRIEKMASRAVAAGEKVEFVDEPKAAAEKPVRLRAIYADEWVVAIDKPPGLVSGPTKDVDRPHAEKIAKRQFGNELTLLHRLDRDTSGALLFGRTKGANTALLEAFKKREIEKRYLAVCAGKTKAEFSDVRYLKEVGGSRVVIVNSGGMRAETDFTTLATVDGWSLVEARPKTGRMHQIRAQLANLGHPIAGDAIYGGAAVVGEGGQRAARQMLHAWRVAFAHPGNGERLEIVCPPPEDFREVVEALFGGAVLKNIGKGS